MSRWFFPLILAVSLQVFAQDNSVPKVDAAEAEKHLIQKIEPVPTPLITKLGIGGDVIFTALVSPAGDVVSLKVKSGHPFLISTAKDALRKWKYAPFLVDGKPAKVEIEVTVQFPGGLTPKEEEINSKYFKLSDECRKLLQVSKLKEAESVCRDSVKTSDLLRPGRVLERSGARSWFAHSLFLQGRVQEALPLYEEALRLNKGYLEPNDADLASDHWNLARAYGSLGDLKRADELFAIAESTFEAAIKNLPAEKDNYTKRLKRVLMEYANLKDALQQKEEAQRLRTKASSL